MKINPSYGINSKKAICSKMEKQGGSIPRVIQEAIQNSIDAESKRIYLELSSMILSMKDNGNGIKDLTEIEDFLITAYESTKSMIAGFIGYLGLGFWQLMAKGRLNLLSNNLRFISDYIPKTKIDAIKGFNYDFVEYNGNKRNVKTYADNDQPQLNGTEIEILLYKKLADNQIEEIGKEVFRKLFITSENPIEISFNGKEIDKIDVSDEKLHYQSNEKFEAIYVSKEESRVFLKGMFVCNNPSYSKGKNWYINSIEHMNVTENRNEFIRDEHYDELMEFMDVLDCYFLENYENLSGNHTILTDEHFSLLKSLVQNKTLKSDKIENLKYYRPETKTGKVVYSFKDMKNNKNISISDLDGIDDLEEIISKRLFVEMKLIPFELSYWDKEFLNKHFGVEFQWSNTEIEELITKTHKEIEKPIDNEEMTKILTINSKGNMKKLKQMKFIKLAVKYLWKNTNEYHDKDVSFSEAGNKYEYIVKSDSLKVNLDSFDYNQNQDQKDNGIEINKYTRRMKTIDILINANFTEDLTKEQLEERPAEIYYQEIRDYYTNNTNSIGFLIGLTDKQIEVFGSKYFDVTTIIIKNQKGKETTTTIWE